MNKVATIWSLVIHNDSWWGETHSYRRYKADNKEIPIGVAWVESGTKGIEASVLILRENGKRIWIDKSDFSSVEEAKDWADSNLVEQGWRLLTVDIESFK